MEKRISLDCDGVIADVGGFFKKSFYDYFGSEASNEFIQSLYKNNLDHKELGEFFKKYEKKLFLSLHELKLVEGAKEGINEMKKKGIEIIVNSYRPSEYKNFKQNTLKLTKDWFKKNGVYVPLNLAESKEEKIKNINSGNFYYHIDDNVGVLEEINKNKITPVLFNKLYNPKSMFPYFNSWLDLTKFLVNQKNV